jgi:RNA polymerase sigma factor (sigma-70 family)
VTDLVREEEWASLMRAGMAGDAIAYRQFLRSVTPHLRAVTHACQRSFGAGEGDVEDVVQEVLLAVHLKSGTWDTSRPISPWLAAIVRNKLIDMLRRRGRHVHVPIEDVTETLAAEESCDGLQALEIDGFLRQLKPRQRDIVQSISVDGSSIRETASRFQMTEGAVRVTLHRALKTLAALYRAGAR